MRLSFNEWGHDKVVARGLALLLFAVGIAMLVSKNAVNFGSMGYAMIFLGAIFLCFAQFGFTMRCYNCFNCGKVSESVHVKHVEKLMNKLIRDGWHIGDDEILCSGQVFPYTGSGNEFR